MNAALETRIPRLVYTSSVATVARHKNGTPSIEADYAKMNDMPGAYERSKIEAERIVRDMASQKSLPVIIVNPSAPVGAFDLKPTPLGKTIVDLLHGKAFGYLSSGLNIVDAEDVAEGHIRAFEKGTIGERYILGNKNMTLKEFFDMACSIGKANPPKLKISYPLVWLAGYSSEAVSQLSRKPPAVPLNGVKLAKEKMYFDSSKAITELGFPQTSVEESVRKSIMWFRAHKYA
ncbi:MAG: NAD-dependent epimerase/dehydratase family protein [Dehalococcoidia bacterium]|nr:NAD-dependent epimerase/dehydratase family protein [Dehalococcoidia bacterium]